MKISLIYLVSIFTLLLCSITLAQFADDLRVFPSADHQTENSITIDPTNPNNLIAASIGSPLSGGIKTPYFYSHDGGITWEGSSNSPNSVSTKGDPFVIFNNWGDAFFISKGDPGINFFKSTNKGESWITKSKITTSSDADKPHVTIGTSESNKDHVYAVWSNVDVEDFRVVFRRSTDRGENFQGFRTIYSHIDEEGLGAYVAAGPEGNVYVAFVTLAKTSLTQKSILMYKSTDGGVNFESNPILEIDIQGMGRATAFNSNFNGTRVNSFPFMAVDPSGDLYIVYTNNTSTEGGDIHIYLRKSSNQGATWSGAIEVHNGQPGVRQWFPSIALDKTDGTIYISYYNMVSGSPNYTSYRNVATSTDGGSSFDIIQVSDVSFVPDDIGVPGYSLSFMGDYYEIAAYNGMAYPCWSDNRTGIFQAYVSPIGGAEVELDQKLADNQTTIDKVDYWSSSAFKELEIPKTYHFKPNVNQVLRGDQGIISNEKYNKWNLDNNVENHRTFTFQPGQTILISELDPTYDGIEIKNNLIEVNNIDAGKLQFKDPWFINYNDPANYQDQYGFKNLGSGAIYEWVNSPFNPNTNISGEGSEYKGVFLNQDPSLGLQTYSISSVPHDIDLTQTGRTHKFYWQSWEYDPLNVSLESQNNSSTNVVFLSDNTTITANIKGTNLSNDVKAYDNNSQRKFVRTGNGNLHSVYISMGALWYERSTDGGQTWEIANHQNRPLHTNNPKHVSIDYLPTVTGDDIVLITYQHQTTTGSRVVIDVFVNGQPRTIINYRYEVVSFVHSSSEYDEMNAEPVIALTYGSYSVPDFLIVFKVPGLLPLNSNGPTINGNGPTIAGLYRSFG